MGILDNFRKDKENLATTRGFYFGAPEAEGENKDGIQNLVAYFDDYLGILEQLYHERFIFTGRKGVGKSAIAKFIKDKSDRADDSYAQLIPSHEYDLENLIQIGDLQNELNHEAIFFEWLILVNLIKLIVKNESGKRSEGYEKLKKFIERNSGIVDIDQYQIQEIIVKKKYEASFKVLRHVFDGVFGKYFDTKTHKAPFYKLIPPLREVVKKVIKYPVNVDKEFWLLFDDLDIGFSKNDISSNKKITELIRIAKKYNTDILKGTNTKVLIFIRDDIKKLIETKTSDTSKIFLSYEIHINWYDHDQFRQSENSIPLKRFINKRIGQNFLANKISFDDKDPWSSLFQESFKDYNNKSSLKYVIDFTSYRPRDLITFLMRVGQNDYTFPLEPRNVKELLISYIDNNISEIKNELSLHFDSREVELLFMEVFPFIAENPDINYMRLHNEIDSLKFSLDSGKIIEILYYYSLLAYKDLETGRLYFHYRENPTFHTYDKQKMSITLPKLIYHHYMKI